MDAPRSLPLQRGDSTVTSLSKITATTGTPRSEDAVQRLRRTLTSQEDVVSDTDSVDHSGCGYGLVDSMGFKGGVGVCVFLNSMQMGLEADYPEWSEAWQVCENVFTGVFLAEAFLKICVMRLRYFKDRWNWIDVSLVVLSMLDMWVFPSLFAADMQSLSILRVFRLFRLARILRLIKRVKKLVLVIQAVIKALQSTIWVSTVMILMLYVGAVFVVGFLGHDRGALYPGFTKDRAVMEETDLLIEFNPYISFGSIGSSMLTLFSIMILAEWSEIVKPVMLYQPYLVPFFVAFIGVATFGVMNVIVGLIVESVIVGARKAENEDQQAEVLKKLEVLKELQTLSTKLLEESGGEIDLIALESCINDENSGMKKMLKEVDLPRGFAADEIMYLLDDNANGSLTQDELIEGFYRLIDSGSFQRLCLIQKNQNRLKRLFIENHDSMAAAIDRQGSRLEELAAIIVEAVRGSAMPSNESACADSFVSNLESSSARPTRPALPRLVGCQPAPAKVPRLIPGATETCEQMALRLQQSQLEMESLLQASLQQLCKVGLDAVHRAGVAEAVASSSDRGSGDRGARCVQFQPSASHSSEIPPPPAIEESYHTIEADASEALPKFTTVTLDEKAKSPGSTLKGPKLITQISTSDFLSIHPGTSQPRDPF